MSFSADFLLAKNGNVGHKKDNGQTVDVVVVVVSLDLADSVTFPGRGFPVPIFLIAD